MRQKPWSHVDDPKAAGRRLRAARERAGLSQRQLAFPGCTAAYISRLESGDRTPSLQLLREIGKRLGVSADWLATGVEVESASELLLRAELALQLGDVDDAETLFEAARERDDAAVRALGLGGLGRIALARGDTGRAARQLEEARAALGDAAVAAPEVVEALARAHAARGETDAAAGVLDDALGRAGDDAAARLRYALLLAHTLLDAGQAGRGADVAERATAAVDALGDPAALAQLYQSLARAYSARGVPAIAGRYTARALATLELADAARQAERVQHVRATAELARDDAQAALAVAEAALRASPQPRVREGEVLIRVDRARALAALGRLPEAHAAAVELVDAVGGLEPADAVASYTALAEVLAAAGDSTRALEVFELAAGRLDDRTASGARPLFARWAELLETAGRPEEALRVLKRAMGAPGSRAGRGNL